LHDAFKAAEHGDAAIGVRGIAVPLISRNGERHVAHLLPLASGKRHRTGIAITATAALFVHKAALETPSRPEAIAKAYKLTPTELRILLALVEVGGGPEIAEALGIADGTVKRPISGISFKKPAPDIKPISSSSSPGLPARLSTEPRISYHRGAGLPRSGDAALLIARYNTQAEITFIAS